jgi:putative ABC transport system permease protein
MVKELGIKHPLGNIIKSDGLYFKRGEARIIGVVKDFDFKPLDRKISPAMLKFNLSSGWTYVYVRLKPGNITSTMSFLKMKWDEVMPGMPFEYHFLDDYLNSLYESAQRWNKIVDCSAAFAVILALMGMFGLASFMVEKRTKELGIRRILGAKLIDISRLIYGEFVVMILLGSVVACPIAWYFMHKWLQDFAYRIDITIWPFLVVSTAILLGTLIITLIHVARTATANPVESLRYE